MSWLEVESAAKRTLMLPPIIAASGPLPHALSVIDDVISRQVVLVIGAIARDAGVDPGSSQDSNRAGASAPHLHIACLALSQYEYLVTGVDDPTSAPRSSVGLPCLGPSDDTRFPAVCQPLCPFIPLSRRFIAYRLPSRWGVPTVPAITSPMEVDNVIP